MSKSGLREVAPRQKVALASGLVAALWHAARCTPRARFMCLRHVHILPVPDHLDVGQMQAWRCRPDASTEMCTVGQMQAGDVGLQMQGWRYRPDAGMEMYSIGSI